MSILYKKPQQYQEGGKPVQQTAPFERNPSSRFMPGSEQPGARVGAQELAVSAPQYKTISPLTYQQTLKRKGYAIPEGASADEINAQLRTTFGVAEDAPLQYRAILNEDGTIGYQKDIGRTRGEVYQKGPIGGIVSETYNKPRVTR